MQPSGKRHSTGNWEESKNIARHYNTAVHKRKHGNKHQYIHNSLKDTKKCIITAEKRLVPLPV